MTKTTPQKQLNICPKCGAELDAFHVCRSCGFYAPVGARDRIRMIADPSTFTELSFETADLSSRFHYADKVERARKRTSLSEAIVTGTCLIGGVKVVLGAMDSGFMMGTLSVAVGEAITAAFEYASEHCLPVILFCASGGVRVQEGMFALVQMSKVAAAMQRHRDRGLLYISCLTNPTMGGVSASFGLSGDINIAEKHSQIGFAGKAIINEFFRETPDESFQTERFCEQNGMIDLIAERQEFRDLLSDILRMVCQREHTAGKRADQARPRPLTDHCRDDLFQALRTARDIRRPKGRDYLVRLFDRHIELDGDRIYGSDASIFSGIGCIGGSTFVYHIQNKGRSLEENLASNFGLTGPDGYRKVLRLSRLAEKLCIPVVNLIDSAGADFSIRSEANGQSAAIASCISAFSTLKTVVIAVVLGEGSSGGALALSVGDALGMLKNAIYTVISPEAYVRIIREEQAVSCELLERMRFTAHDLSEDGIIDEIIDETDDISYNTLAIKRFILDTCDALRSLSVDALLQRRYERIRNWDRVVRRTL